MFLVKVYRSEEGQRLTGLVENVRTGEKHRFQELGEVAGLIARMAVGQGEAPPPPDRTSA